MLALQLGRPAPVLIPRECNGMLAYLANDKIRREATINSTSPYIFTNTRLGAVRGYDALKSACDDCSANLMSAADYDNVTQKVLCNNHTGKNTTFDTT